MALVEPEVPRIDHVFTCLAGVRVLVYLDVVQVDGENDMPSVTR